jgi:hypothetical protein
LVVAANIALAGVRCTASEFLEPPRPRSALFFFEQIDLRIAGMADHDLLHPEHWRDRAESTRAMARDATEPDERQRLLEVARGYERFAVRAEDWKPADKKT